MRASGSNFLLVAGAGSLLVAGAGLLPGCSAERSSETRDGERAVASSPSTGRVARVAQRIQDGVVDTKHRFAVGLCRGARSIDPGRTCPGRCSGALILPNVVATARHCVDETPAAIDCAAESPRFGKRKPPLLVTTNDDMFGIDEVGWYTVQSYEVPDDDRFCGNDIALLVLSRSVPPEEATPVAPGVQYLMWDPAANYSMEYSAIGYGQLGPGGASGARHRRDFINVVCIPGADTKRIACPESAKIPESEFVGGNGLCFGDSGSNAFERRSFEARAPVAFGVLSRGGEDDTTCAGSVYTRFDAHRDFVLRVARSASQDWTLYPEPPWTALKPPPERRDRPPDAGALLGFGAECAGDAECASSRCVDSGNETWMCSQSCDADVAESCPQGFECRDALCLPSMEETLPRAAPTTIIIKRTGCSLGPPPGDLRGGLTSAAAVTIVALLRQRRNRWKLRNFSQLHTWWWRQVARAASAKT